MAEWARVAQSTITEHMKGETVAVMRNRKLTAMAQKKGRVKMNCSGKDFDWRIRGLRNALTPYGDMAGIDFPRVNRHFTAVLDWRGYRIAESISDKEIEMNKGDEAILDTWSDLADQMKDDFQDQFADEWYIDGNATGNELRMHGIESMMSVSGAASGGYVGVNNDTYAGQTTALAGLGGTWNTSTWPLGTGDAAYDCFTPLVVDYTDTLWSTGSTWAANCIEVLSWTITHANKNKSAKGKLDCFIVTNQMFSDYKLANQGKQRIDVARKSALVELGFDDVINHDGVDITSEYGVPDTQGYGWNFSSLQLRCLNKQLIRVKGPVWNESSDSYRLMLGFWGNLKFESPRDFVKLDNIT